MSNLKIFASADLGPIDRQLYVSVRRPSTSFVLYDKPRITYILLRGQCHSYWPRLRDPTWLVALSYEYCYRKLAVGTTEVSDTYKRST